MGSYTDVLLTITFAESTPDHVLAAFSALGVPPARGEAPELPTPVVEAWPHWEPDWRVAGRAEEDGDPFQDEPWRHDWASVGDGVLRWSGARWELYFRFSLKTYPEAVSDALEWLAPFVAPNEYKRQRRLVGYAHHDYDPAPHIFWVDGDRWERQDTNPEGYIAP